VPAIASQVIDNPFDSGPSATAVRGGSARVVHKPIVPRSHTHKPKPSTTGTSGANGTSGNAGSRRAHGGKAGAVGTSGNAGSGSDHNGTAGTTGTTTPKLPAKVVPKPRSKPLGGTIPAHHATTIVPKPRLPVELPHTT
jgi:hypothetical protein